MTNDLRTAATNTAYLAVGIGVVTAQQVQSKAEQALASAAEVVKSVAPEPAAVRQRVEATVVPVVEQVKFFVEPSLDTLKAQAEGALAQAGASIDTAGARAREARAQLEPKVREAASQVRETAVQVRDAAGEVVQRGVATVEPVVDKARARFN